MIGKDRTGRLPTAEFALNYPLLEQGFGRDTFVRQAVPVELATDEQKAEIAQQIALFGMSDEQVTRVIGESIRRGDHVYAVAAA